MLSLFRSSATAIWALLMAATGFSLSVASGEAWSAVAVIAVGVIKACLIGLYFMELAGSMVLLRALLYAWCLLCCLGIVGFYLLG